MSDDAAKLNASVNVSDTTIGESQNCTDLPGVEPAREAETEHADRPSGNSAGQDNATPKPGVGKAGADSVERRAISEAIDAGVDRVLAAFEAKLAYDATKQIQIDRLHEELQQYRKDLITRTVRPLVNGVIRHHDNIGKLISALRSKPEDELTPERFFSEMASLQEDVEIVLSQNGVAAYREPAGLFDPRRQRVLKKVSTYEESLANTVAESLRPGFEQGAEILEKERVATYELVQQREAATDEVLNTVLAAASPSS